MHTTTITCDHCSCAATTPEEKTAQDIKQVAIGVFENRYSSGSSFDIKDATHKAEWCKKCRDELQLNFHRKDEKTGELPHAPTLEDLIRDIAYDSAREALANQ